MMRQFFALSILLCVGCFACVSSAPPIENFQNQLKPYEGDVPDRVLKESLAIKGYYLEVEIKDNVESISGELLAVYDVGIVVNVMTKDEFNAQNAKDFKLKLIPKNQIDQLTIFDMLSLYNGVIYGSMHWILYPFLSIFHGILMLYSVPTWSTIFLYQIVYGYFLTNMKVEMTSYFDLKFLLPFSRFPHHLPKSLEEKLVEQTSKPSSNSAIQSEDNQANENTTKPILADQSFQVESQNRLPLDLSLGLGLGVKYSISGIYAGLKYVFLKRMVLGLGGSYAFLDGPGGVLSLDLGYLLSPRKMLLLSAGQDFFRDAYQQYRFLSIDYIYDFGQIGGFKALGGASIVNPLDSPSILTPSLNVGIHYTF
jgi:hypothetical protein